MLAQALSMSRPRTAVMTFSGAAAGSAPGWDKTRMQSRNAIRVGIGADAGGRGSGAVRLRCPPWRRRCPGGQWMPSRRWLRTCGTVRTRRPDSTSTIRSPVTALPNVSVVSLCIAMRAGPLALEIPLRVQGQILPVVPRPHAVSTTRGIRADRLRLRRARGAVVSTLPPWVSRGERGFTALPAAAALPTAARGIHAVLS